MGCLGQRVKTRKGRGQAGSGTNKLGKMEAEEYKRGLLSERVAGQHACFNEFYAIYIFIKFHY